jgi:hypothetical protein
VVVGRVIARLDEDVGEAVDQPQPIAQAPGERDQPWRALAGRPGLRDRRQLRRRGTQVIVAQ